jgi:hypothetical protein
MTHPFLRALVIVSAWSPLAVYLRWALHPKGIWFPMPGPQFQLLVSNHQSPHPFVSQCSA